MPKRLLKQAHLRPWKRHSLVLLVAGFVYVMIGAAVFAEPAEQRSQARTVATDVLPIEVWACIFIGVGILACISSRWPPASETWGYASLASLSATWGSFFVWGVVREGAPLGTISGFLVWSIVAFLWWAISGLVNPTETEVGESQDGQ